MPPEKRRSVIVTLRLTEAEAMELDRDCKAAGLSRNLFLVKCWRKGE